MNWFFQSGAGRFRFVPIAALASLLVASVSPCKPALAFDFPDVVRRAEQLAKADYKSPNSNLPKELQNLSYDQYQNIRYKPEEAYWRSAKLPFELQFFHEGWHFDSPVRINEITEQGIHEIKFDPEAFDYGKNKLDVNQLRGLGFAGFRVHYALNTPKYKDEVLVYLGASYFRALGKGQRFGLSGRGLAIDTAVMSGEEFPRVMEFGIERPGPSATQLTIYALLDSPRLTGAYRFVLRPGVSTALDVKVRLYLRENVSKLGLAPLTSMFFFGANQHPNRDDYRPEVHDSDGLLVHGSSGEWIWRPLVNPKQLLVTSFALTNPRGFGLMQRSRDFQDYEDLGGRYELRPSAWVEPKGAWGPGRVELVEIPAPNETEDNIVAYWVSDHPARAKRSEEFEYRILWQKDRETHPPNSWVVQTRRGHGYREHPDNSIGFIVDFNGPALKKLSRDTNVAGNLWVDSNGEILEHRTYPNEVTGGWRLMLRLRRKDDGKPVELRASLLNGKDTVSETWSYILPPG